MNNQNGHVHRPRLPGASLAGDSTHLAGEFTHLAGADLAGVAAEVHLREEGGAPLAGSAGPQVVVQLAEVAHARSLDPTPTGKQHRATSILITHSNAQQGV
eukprot:1177817-Prorocentrum_minimum.AAC.3